MARFSIQSTVDLTGLESFGEGGVAAGNLELLFLDLQCHRQADLLHRVANPTEDCEGQAALVRQLEQDVAVAKQLVANLIVTADATPEE